MTHPFFSVSSHALEINQSLWAGHVLWTPSPSASFRQCKCKFAPFCDSHCDCGGLRTPDSVLRTLDSNPETESWLRPWWSAGMALAGAKEFEPLAIVDISTFDHRSADKDTHICSCHDHRKKLRATCCVWATLRFQFMANATASVAKLITNSTSDSVSGCRCSGSRRLSKDSQIAGHSSSEQDIKTVGLLEVNRLCAQLFSWMSVKGLKSNLKRGYLKCPNRSVIL